MKIDKNYKLKLIIHYNNEFIDILLNEDRYKEICEPKHESNEEYLRSDKYKNGWLYEITLSNFDFCRKQFDEFRGYEHWTEFDIIKVIPIRYVGKYIKTKAQLAYENKEELKLEITNLQKLVSQQTKDNKTWELCEMYGQFGIFSVTGGTFRMYSIEQKIELQKPTTWEFLYQTRKSVESFFNLSKPVPELPF